METQGKLRFFQVTYGKHNENTYVFRGNLWKTLRRHSFSVGTYGNIRKTYVFRWNLLKTQGRHMFSVGTIGKHYENIGFPWEPIGNQ